MVENNIRFSRADQLTQHLKERCRKLGIGEKFLSVRQIMDEFNVSQITVKQAMERLCESACSKRRSGAATSCAMRRVTEKSPA